MYVSNDDSLLRREFYIRESPSWSSPTSVSREIKGKKIDHASNSYKRLQFFLVDDAVILLAYTEEKKEEKYIRDMEEKMFAGIVHKHQSPRGATMFASIFFLVDKMYIPTCWVPR